MKAPQNLSHAVANQRHEPLESLDYFPTPPWATRALMEKLSIPRHELANTFRYVLEPSCGEGHMARPLREYFERVFASDIFDYRSTYPEQDAVWDFTDEADLPMPLKFGRPQWVIFNPPFKIAEPFIYRALDLAVVGVAALVRTNFLEGKSRFYNLFDRHQPATVWTFVERVNMVKGRLDPKGDKPISYSWFVWLKPGFGYLNPADRWIEPCRSALERPEDYFNPGEDDGPLFGGDNESAGDVKARS